MVSTQGFLGNLEVQGETEILKLAAEGKRDKDLTGREEIKCKIEKIGIKERVCTGFSDLPWERQSLPHSWNSLFQKAK